ncbi:MAG: site-specific integrase [Actinomycetota bacterium]|nr:site-specific integrase [Actinomycetota bacterium]
MRRIRRARRRSSWSCAKRGEIATVCECARLWRGGLRISEALALNESDIDERRGSLLIRDGKGYKRREAGMDQFGFEQLATWTHRVLLLPGPLFGVIAGPTRRRRWSATAARAELRQLAVEAGVRRRFVSHQLSHAAQSSVLVRAWRSIIQRELGHTDPRNHLGLPAGHRSQRDHRRRLLSPTADDHHNRRSNSVTRPINKRRPAQCWRPPRP